MERGGRLGRDTPREANNNCQGCCPRPDVSIDGPPYPPPGTTADARGHAAHFPALITFPSGVTSTSPFVSSASYTYFGVDSLEIRPLRPSFTISARTSDRSNCLTA